MRGELSVGGQGLPGLGHGRPEPTGSRRVGTGVHQLAEAGAPPQQTQSDLGVLEFCNARLKFSSLVHPLFGMTGAEVVTTNGGTKVLEATVE